MTEDKKINYSILDNFYYSSNIRALKFFFGAHKRGYSWRHYMKYFASDFQISCELFLELELACVCLYFFLFDFISNNVLK